MIVLDEADELLKADDKNDNGEQHVKDSLVLYEYLYLHHCLCSYSIILGGLEEAHPSADRPRVRNLQ